MARIQRRDVHVKHAAAGALQLQVRGLADLECAGPLRHTGPLLVQQDARVTRAEQGRPGPAVAQADSVVGMHMREEATC